MGRFVNCRIGTKIHLVVGLLALVAIAVGAVAYQALGSYDQQVAMMQQASERALIGEQVNSLIYSAVMDSRGVYMARDAAEVEKFGKPLLLTLAQMQRLADRWLTIMPDGRKAEMAKAMADLRQFLEYRTELVRLGRDAGSGAAREYGDNDANRTNRQNLNTEIHALSLATHDEIAALKAASEAFLRSKIAELLTLAAIGILSTLLLSIVMVRRYITQPIEALTGTIKQLAAGALDIAIPGNERADELGEISRAVLVFKESMLRAVELEHNRLGEAEAKELRRTSLEGLIREFGSDVDGVVRAVGASADGMRGTAQSLSATAEETSRQSVVVAGAAEQASTNVEMVATAAEELHASIAEIGRQVAHSADIAGKAVTEAGQTDASVASLAAAAQKIGEVVQLIQDIASQTNLLALNATIEAARAGEAGKGFAVVASEVKSLANQTAKATEDIAGQVAAIQGATGSVVTAIRGIGSTISEMSEIATAIASAIEEQGAATREIAGNVQQAAKGTHEVSSSIATVTGAAGENGMMAGQVLETATALSQQAANLRERVERFIGAVRSA